MTQHRPIVLIIFDGWGYREHHEYNAIYQAKTPNWDRLWQQYPHTLISSSGLDVGLPDQQMGNSEVGHTHMGAGRQVPQDLVRIDQAIASGDFLDNQTLNQAMDVAKEQQSQIHVFGLLSPGGVHSHEQHLQALITLAEQRGIHQICLHGILDGRDTPPRSALASIAAMEKHLKEKQTGHIASIVGRYYAMDRDTRWDRTQIAYDMYTQGTSPYHADSAAEALEAAYERDENDEFVQATTIGTPSLLQDNDVVIMMNFRADRARQLIYAFTDPEFNAFERKATPKLADCTTLTKYASDIKANIAYPPISLTNVFGEYIANQNIPQLRIAETEKYAHVTFFFNGGREQPFAGEERVLIPSPKVATYDLKPEMCAYEMTDALIAAIKQEKFGAIICNYANADMVGHTGDMEATISAIETLDACLGNVIDALISVGGEALITADHGNAEFMFNELTNQPHTAHTNNPVPALYVGRDATIKENGTLVDIAPTLIHLLGLEQPSEMTGETLFRCDD